MVANFNEHRYDRGVNIVGSHVYHIWGVIFLRTTYDGISYMEMLLIDGVDITSIQHVVIT